MKIGSTVLMIIAILQYSVIPLVANLNQAHARNLCWPAQARFHVVRQILKGVDIAAVALFLLWLPTIERQLGICLAAILGFCVLGAFFTARHFVIGALIDLRGQFPNNIF